MVCHSWWRFWFVGDCVGRIPSSLVAVAVACAGCAMFDESAAVPAAAEYDVDPSDAQPLGPYSCTIAEAGGSTFVCVRTRLRVRCTHPHLNGSERACGGWAGLRYRGVSMGYATIHNCGGYSVVALSNRHTISRVPPAAVAGSRVLLPPLHRRPSAAAAVESTTR